MTSKVVIKEMSKQKNEGKDDGPRKKGPGTPGSEKQPSPSKSIYGVGKGLIMGKGLITEVVVCCLLTHKEHAIEMVELIINETNLDHYANQTIEDLGASGLFDLSRVHFFQITSFMCYLSIRFLMVVLISCIGLYNDALRQVCRFGGGDPSVSKASGDQE